MQIFWNAGCHLVALNFQTLGNAYSFFQSFIFCSCCYLICFVVILQVWYYRCDSGCNYNSEFLNMMNNIGFDKIAFRSWLGIGLNEISDWFWNFFQVHLKTSQITNCRHVCTNCTSVIFLIFLPNVLHIFIVVCLWSEIILSNWGTALDCI